MSDLRQCAGLNNTLSISSATSCCDPNPDSSSEPIQPKPKSYIPLRPVTDLRKTIGSCSENISHCVDPKP